MLGPTAIGKTALSLEIAEQCNCEIISVDSMQVYRYMDVGTAKASLAERRRIPHHLIDILDPDEEYTAGQFADDALECIEEIVKRRHLPLLTGGTGLYFRAVLQGFSPEIPTDKNIRKMLQQRLAAEGNDALYRELQRRDSISAERIHKNDTHRLIRALEVYQTSGIPWSRYLSEHKKDQRGRFPGDICHIGLTDKREVLYRRINQRCEQMLEKGLQDEVEGLLARGYGPELKAMNSIGYRHMTSYLQNLCSYDQMLQTLKRDTRRYAKRQYTWFNKNKEIEWFDVHKPEYVLRRISDFLKG